MNLRDFTCGILRLLRLSHFCQAQLFVPEGDSAAVRRLRRATASEAEISGNLEGR